MSSQTAKFFKGVTTGMVIGAAITMLADPVSDKQRNKLMRKTEGVFKNMGEMLDSAIAIFR